MLYISNINYEGYQLTSKFYGPGGTRQQLGTGQQIDPKHNQLAFVKDFNVVCICVVDLMICN